MPTSTHELIQMMIQSQIHREGVDATARGLDEMPGLSQFATTLRLVVSETQRALRASNQATPNVATSAPVTTDEVAHSFKIGDLVISKEQLVGILTQSEKQIRELEEQTGGWVEEYDKLNQVVCDTKEELGLMRLLLQEIHIAGRVTDRTAGMMEAIHAEYESWEPAKFDDRRDLPTSEDARRSYNTLLRRRYQAVRTGQLATAAPAIGTAVSAADPHGGLDMVLPAQWQHDFMLRALQSDALLRQMSPAKRAAAQLLDLYGHMPDTDRGQFELFKKAFTSMGAAAALGVVRRHFGESVDPMLQNAVTKLVEMEGHFPEMGAHAASKAAEEALCLMHLENTCRRVGVRPLTRAGFSALYLGEYSEVRLRFAGFTTVRRDAITKFLRDEEAGKAFWRALCVRAGLPVEPYDGNVFQIEHILNTAWGGVDHYFNFMVLHRVLNNAAEFRYGPGEVKMILLGAHKFAFVQRFARWDRATDSATPRDAFLKIESEHYALPAVSLRGRQLQLRESLSKRARTRA